MRNTVPHLPTRIDDYLQRDSNSRLCTYNTRRSVCSLLYRHWRRLVDNRSWSLTKITCHQYQSLAARHEYQTLLYPLVKGITGAVGSGRLTNTIWLWTLLPRNGRSVFNACLWYRAILDRTHTAISGHISKPSVAAIINIQNKIITTTSFPKN